MQITLSPAEQRVLDQVSKGKATKQIAADLGISSFTVARHKVSMFKKTGAWNIIALIRMFYVLRDKATGEIYPPFEVKWNENFRAEMSPEYARKQKARWKLCRAVDQGKMTRPKICSKCGETCKPEGHHADYDKPLEIVWMCAACHDEHHRLHGFN